MTVSKKILEAFKPLGIPVYADFYGEKEDEYITFNYADEHGADFGDNRPLANVASMQVHWFLPRDNSYLARKRAIKTALFNAGFTYPEVTEFVENPDDNSETAIRHVIFECEIADDEAPLDE